jgi:type II secretory pathway component GspD/PulD (secretin)
MKHTICVLLCLGVWATAATNLVFRIHLLMFAEPDPVAEMARQIVGTDGKVMLDKTGNRLFIHATEDQHRQIGDLIKQVSVPPKNIQIQVRINDAGGGTSRGMGVTDAGGSVVIGGGVQVRGGVRGFAGDTSVQTSQDSAQFITVSSGRRGSINVSEETPFVEWFLEYGVRFGYLQAGITWRQVGSRLLVEPRVVGDGSMINVKLIPEFSYWVDNKSFTTAFINAATELNVANGAEFRVGSTTQNQEFMNKFLIGYDRTRRQRAVDIVLKATILP